MPVPIIEKLLIPVVPLPEMRHCFATETMLGGRCYRPTSYLNVIRYCFPGATLSRTEPSKGVETLSAVPFSVILDIDCPRGTLSLCSPATSGRSTGGRSSVSSPTQINFYSAARAKPFYRSFGPHSRKRRQKTNFSGVALEQHFSHSGGAAKVPIDLKRGVIVQEVRQSGLRKQCHNVFVRQIAF